MRWSTQRQLFYALGALFIVVVLGTLVWYGFFYQRATCTDNIQNQNEEGVDCGGVCAKLCVAPPVTALWSRAVRIAPGVYHAVALVKNPKSDALGIGLPYSFSLFGTHQKDSIRDLIWRSTKIKRSMPYWNQSGKNLIRIFEKKN